MKKLLLFALLLIGFSAIKAQTPISYSEVVQVEGATKDELYQRAKNWIVNAFRDANAVIQLDDKEAGQIIGKGNFSYPQKVKGSLGMAYWECTISFKVSIAIKEGRYKYEITDFFHEARHSNSYSKAILGLLTDEAPAKGYQKDLYSVAVEKTDENVEEAVADLREAMSSPTETQTDDW